MEMVQGGIVLLLICGAFLPTVLSNKPCFRWSNVLFVLFLAWAFLPTLFWGVVVDWKIDDGYWLLFRDDDRGWEQSNVALYYLHAWYIGAQIGCAGVMAVAAIRQAQRKFLAPKDE